MRDTPNPDDMRVPGIVERKIRSAIVCVTISLLVAHHPVARSQSIDGETSPTVQPNTGELANRRLRLDYTTNEISLKVSLPESSASSKRARGEVRENGPLVIGYERQLPRAFQGDLSPRFDWTPLDDGSIVSALSLTSPGALAMRRAQRRLPDGGTAPAER